MTAGHPPNQGRAIAVLLVLVLAAGAVAGCSDDAESSGDGTGSTETTGAQAACSSPDWVAAWSAAPSDAANALDATFAPLPGRFDHQTVRNVVTPHLGSSGEIRVRLTNRFTTEPVTFGAVTIGASEPNGGVSSPVPVTFEGDGSATAAPGEDLVSDPVALQFDAFEKLAVSLFLPSTAGQLTKHWNANATTFITPVAGGDQTDTTSGDVFQQTVQSWLGVAAVEVEAEPGTRAIVALGDSLTDGWVTASPDPSDLDVSVADADLRYPDFLQHRLDEARISISVQNAGLSANQLLVGGSGITGISALERFDADVSAVAGAKGVIIFEGINDLGLSHAPAAAIIDALDQLITDARNADLAVWLATIPPASDSALHGIGAAPNSEKDRQVINDWIRTEADVDGYFDFDEAVRDPADPTILDTRYASPDHLHLNPSGYERIADAIDLDELADATC